MTDERITVPGENSSFDRDGIVYQNKISEKIQVNVPIYIEDRQYDVAKLSAAGDQAKVETVIDNDLAKLVDINPKNMKSDKLDVGAECIILLDNQGVQMIHSEGEEVLLEDHSPMDDSELTEDEFDNDGHTDVGNIKQRNLDSLVVIGRGLRLHTPPRDGPIVKESGYHPLPPEEEEDNEANINVTPLTSGEDIHLDSDVVLAPSTPPEIKRTGSARRPTLSPVIEEDVREYMQTWSYEGDDDQEVHNEDDVDCGAGDATANVVESLITVDSSDDDYANEMSRVLSSAALDAALAEIDYEHNVQSSKNLQTGYIEELDDSCDDIVIILPEAHELNYHNVPVGSSLDYSLQDAANARVQLDAQADFLENSLNCLEITLDRMALNEAVMPDGSVVFLGDQLRKAKSGHLLRAWERAKENQDEYFSCVELEKPLAQIQREHYQDQIKSFSSANQDMRKAVTQATRQEQALRGQAHQVQQTYDGLEQNIANMSHELVGLQARQHHLQNALMEERIAKEAAQRDNERIYRRSSSDIIQPNSDVLIENHSRRPRQPEWMSDGSVSLSSSEDLPTSASLSGPLPQTGGQRWWTQQEGGQREYDYIQPPPWRRGYRPSGGRRFGQRPGWHGWRSNHGNNWRWSETRDGPRPWERRRPPHRLFFNRPRPPPPFTQPFKKETEVILTQYFHEMGRVEHLLRERGFAKGPVAAPPATSYRPRPMRYQRYGSSSHQGGWDSQLRREGLGSRSVPSMGRVGLPYRERSQRNTDWFDTSRSQTDNQMNERLSEENIQTTVGTLQATASA